jgi:hypothetical protein
LQPFGAARDIRALTVMVRLPCAGTDALPEKLLTVMDFAPHAVDVVLTVVRTESTVIRVPLGLVTVSRNDRTAPGYKPCPPPEIRNVCFAAEAVPGPPSSDVP